MLAHLHDAADALDYISQQHSLQHLDVKPENLLLVGGRIKVADFGLVKDLQDVNSSIVGGLTPVYAAPELFDGRPSIHSDQYSLAIVYQEMLTGVLPFEGRTTAQLAAQHLHSRPRLDRLPASDQPTIARALAKDPEQRFRSCRDMIEGLLDATPNRRAAAVAAVRAAAAEVENAPASPRVDTEVVSRDAISAARRGRRRSALQQDAAHRAAAGRARSAAAGDWSPTEIECRPTIFLGVGGLAARTLQTLAPTHRGPLRRSGRAARLAVPALRDRRRKPEDWPPTAARRRCRTIRPYCCRCASRPITAASPAAASTG